MAFRVLGLAFGFQTLVPDQFTRLVLDRSGRLFYFPLNLVFIYNSPFLRPPIKPSAVRL